MADHKIRYAVIFEDPEAEEVKGVFKAGYRIAGGRLKVEKNDTVRLFNLTDSKADVTFTKDALFGEKSFTLPPGKSIEKGDIEPGYYPYTVKIGDAEAEASKPIVIGYP